MTMNPNTKIDRKALATELAQEIGAEVNYRGVPTCAYQVGPYTINRDASIAGDDLEAIRDFLIRHDYIHQEPAADPADAEPSPTEGTVEEDESTTAEDSIPAVEESTTPDETNVSVPISDLDANSLVNLLKLVYAKQSLIVAMTQCDFLFIDEELIDLLNDEKPNSVEAISELIQSEARVNMIRGLDVKEDRLTFTFPFHDDNPTAWASYAKLMLALIDRAKKAQHINAKRIEPAKSEMKYYCNSLLMQLGFGGADFKADRAVLLGHLTGYAAFKSADKMEAHKEKFSARRKAARLASETAQDDLKAPADEASNDSEGVIA